MCESGFSSMQFPTRIVIGLGARAAEEDKPAEAKGNHRIIIGIRPISAGTSLLRGSASLCFFFFFRVHYILANRKNENVSDNNSFCNDPRARDVLQSLSRSFYAIIPRSRLF